MAINVNDRSAAVEAMAVEYPMLEALMGGTRAMRLGREKFLPKWPNEPGEAYDARIKVATLFPAYRRTINVMAGKPFSKELQLAKETPPQITEWAQDIDREGVSLHVFASEMFREGFYGLAGILVEAPKPVVTDKPVITEADQQQAGVRPYFVRVMHDQILGWIEENNNGQRRLLQLRLKECVKERDGLFGEIDVDQVRVLVPGAWATYRKAGNTQEWAVYESGETTLREIPFVPIYGERVGFMRGNCPLLDLAYMNVEHWQSKSDQQTILHVARVPILFAKGFSDTDELTVGAGMAVKAESKEADLKFVEHQGGAIGAGQKSLEALEDQMIQAGAELMVKRASGSKTAAEDVNDAEGNKSDLQRMVENFEDSLNAALALMAEYASLPPGAAVTLFKDFGASTLSQASAQLIKDLAVAGIISDETAINELKRRGELDSEVNAQDEAERVKQQGPSLGEIEPAVA